jgi:putative peptidoglycan lipid II flippase
VGRLFQTGLSSASGLFIYAVLAHAAGVPEARQVVHQLTRRLPRLNR